MRRCFDAAVVVAMINAAALMLAAFITLLRRRLRHASLPATCCHFDAVMLMPLCALLMILQRYAAGHTRCDVGVSAC